MKENIKTAIDGLLTVTPEPEGYTGEDGLLYCGKCHTPKEAYFPEGKELIPGHDRHPILCDCQKKEQEEQRAEQEERRHSQTVDRLKQQGFTDPAMREWTFANDNGRCQQMENAHFYVESWELVKTENIGLLLWGDVGIGKSFFAGCIDNALMEKEIPVCMTNFARIINDLASRFEGRNEYIDRLCRYPLLILDDFGMERDTGYGLEQVYNVMFCADCGSVLYQQRYQTDKRKQDCYICGSYKKRTTDCTAHFIRTDLLAAGVTENIRKITSYATKHETRFRKLLIEQNEDGGKKKNAARRKELEAAEKRITELSAIFKRLYEDSVAGRITDERFTELSADYEAEQKQLKDRAADLEAELSKAQETTANADRFLKVIQKYTGFEELTHTLLREFVEKIVVHECYHDENGIRRQDVDIYYNFVGKVDLPE